MAEPLNARLGTIKNGSKEGLLLPLAQRPSVSMSAATCFNGASSDRAPPALDFEPQMDLETGSAAFKVSQGALRRAVQRAIRGSKI